MINFKKFLTKKTILLFLVLVVILYLGRRCMGIIEGVANIVDNTGQGAKDASSIMDKPGCWYQLPSGCPNRAWNPSKGWLRDWWGEVNRNAKVNQLDCEETTKTNFNNWCGVTDTITQWTHSPSSKIPTKQGCYSYLPKGCKRGWVSKYGDNDGAGAKTWAEDTWGEETRIDVSEEGCGETRKNEINEYCNIDDAEMKFIPKPPPPPCDNWQKCADEGEVCKFNGTQNIIYSKPISQGTQPNPNASLLFKNQTSSFKCNNSAGGDPAHGYRKACYYCPPKVSISCSKCGGSAALSENHNTGCPKGERPWDMCTDPTGTYWGYGWADAQNIYNNVYNGGSSLRRSLASAGNCTSDSRYNPATSMHQTCIKNNGDAKDQRPSTWRPKETGCHLWTDDFDQRCRDTFGNEYNMDTRSQGNCLLGQGTAKCKVYNKGDIKSGAKCGFWGSIQSSWCNNDYGSNWTYVDKHGYNCGGGKGKVECKRS